MSAAYDAIVIGGGPGGLTAGMYLARAGRKTLLLEQALLGGQIAQTSHVENYPGFPDGLSGRDLIDRMEQQARKFGLEIQFGRVEALRVDRDGAKEVVVSGFPFQARVVVVATGLVQRLGIPGEEEYLGRGVSYCATCDGALYRGRPVALVGASDWAMEEAHFLSRFAEPLYLVIPGAELKPTSDLRRELLAHPHVEVVTRARPVEVLADEQGVTGLRIEDRSSGRMRDLAVDGVFIFSGRKRPGTDFLQGVVDLDDQGYVVVGEDCETSVPGVYAVGDVRRRRFHQVATAVGDGAVAGMDALRHLKGEPG
ncbi:NAD(P)/FAD-dependent oxidoreductase [Deferrisoma camini]|uniref:NAD(P)/FAD-dependent oxidoreductase n=1 Tax=Deferrisoma camini TaxID=1035120 RepID=UPI00046C9D15|nr:FAD-dependent oxidoreductase [Deferrisoma camini]